MKIQHIVRSSNPTAALCGKKGKRKPHPNNGHPVCAGCATAVMTREGSLARTLDEMDRVLLAATEDGLDREVALVWLTALVEMTR